MIEKIKRNWSIVLISLATVILGAIAIITAIKLYQIGKQPIAPTAPMPAPAAEITVAPTAATPCSFSFCISSPTPTGTITGTPTSTLTPTATVTLTGTPQPTPTPITSCYNECTSDSTCRSGLKCQLVENREPKRCVNTNCETESDCTCNVHCWEVCGHSSECSSGQSCRQIGTIKRCALDSAVSTCDTEAVCCALPTATNTPTTKLVTSVVKATATPTVYVAPVVVPESGFTLPTIGAIVGGLTLLILSLL